ncbi:MAG: diguanylate cyclase [Chloroflexi bacterium]|nr:diguanylate cyclase [Chloroflexota bacterium]
MTVQYRGQSLGGITVSIGVSVFPAHGRSVDAILSAADGALYRAKHTGRDRFIVAASDK